MGCVAFNGFYIPPTQVEATTCGPSSNVYDNIGYPPGGDLPLIWYPNLLSYHTPPHKFISNHFPLRLVHAPIQYSK